ncbi:hypothetical protein [Streptomyces sp. UNOB3_S3]|uniref:hypothetical protein n=1 Tax=Streptomyces sp. UNOB3_S3 TaxID=2871682 RepID=UPI001E368ED0|nr:hypothetical protein [Streptomyces sp. UNOB3_S3]MCC3773480.1 hypothetical protein [Streptomyces sp. UNOB3_S3]
MEIAAMFASALMQAMVTEGWQSARNAVITLWRNRRPGEAPLVQNELDAHQAQMHQASMYGDIARAEQAIGWHWQQRAQSLLSEQPDAANELRWISHQDFSMKVHIGGTTQSQSTGGHHNNPIQVGRDYLRVTTRRSMAEQSHSPAWIKTLTWIGSLLGIVGLAIAGMPFLEAFTAEVPPGQIPDPPSFKNFGVGVVVFFVGMVTVIVAQLGRATVRHTG